MIKQISGRKNRYNVIFCFFFICFLLKNSSLHQENTLLKKNICALIKTAKMEIFRKDEEISKLSKR